MIPDKDDYIVAVISSQENVVLTRDRQIEKWNRMWEIDPHKYSHHTNMPK